MEQSEDLATLAAVFRAAYRQLAATDASLLAMYYAEGLTNLNVASILGISPGTATRRRQRAEQSLRDLLQQEAENQNESLASLWERLETTRGDFANALFRTLAESHEEAGS